MKVNSKFLKNGLLVTSVVMYFYLAFVGRNQYLFSMGYFRCLGMMLLTCLFIFMYGLIDNKEETYKKNINTYIVLYVIMLFSFTFIIGRTRIEFHTNLHIGNLKLFNTIIAQFERGSFFSILKNVIGNSIMLIPFSFLLMIKDKKYNNLFKQFVILFPFVLGIELFQAFTHTGVFDVDDIFLNYGFTVLFTFLITRFSIIDKIRKLFYTDFELSEKPKKKLFYLSIVIFCLYSGLIVLKVI